MSGTASPRTGRGGRRSGSSRSRSTPWIGERRVGEITRRDIRDLIDGIVDRGSPVGANRTLAVLRRFFAWLIERDVLSKSPCAGLKKPTLERSRDRVLSDDELVLVWRAAERIDFPFGPLVKLLILTGQRLGEVAGMRRAELDLRGKSPSWTIPAERVKNGREHVVPLSPAACGIIAELPRIGRSDFLFTTNGSSIVSGYSRAKDRIDAAMRALTPPDAEGLGKHADDVEAIPHWTFHDLRRTMASGMARLGLQLPVIERCLNHVSGSFAGVAGVYQRHSFADEMRTAFEAWARHVEGIVGGAPAKIIELRAAR